MGYMHAHVLCLGWLGMGAVPGTACAVAVRKQWLGPPVTRCFAQGWVCVAGVPSQLKAKITTASCRPSAHTSTTLVQRLQLSRLVGFAGHAAACAAVVCVYCWLGTVANVCVSHGTHIPRGQYGAKGNSRMGGLVLEACGVLRPTEWFRHWGGHCDCGSTGYF